MGHDKSFIRHSPHLGNGCRIHQKKNRGALDTLAAFLYRQIQRFVRIGEIIDQVFFFAILMRDVKVGFERQVGQYDHVKGLERRRHVSGFSRHDTLLQGQQQTTVFTGVIEPEHCCGVISRNFEMLIHPVKDLSRQHLPGPAGDLFNIKTSAKFFNQIINRDITRHSDQPVGRQHRQTGIFHRTQIHQGPIVRAVRRKLTMTFQHQPAQLQRRCIAMVTVGNVERPVFKHTAHLCYDLRVSHRPDGVDASILVFNRTEG